MNLPLRVLESAGPEPVVSVDGAFGAPGLELSHWPGNRTPADLKHDLSTGIALAFARLAPAERARRAAGCTAIANNHYDTDGALALFAVARPEAALAREGALLDAAAAGDLFRAPSERAVALDALVTALADADASPWADLFRGREGARKHEVLLGALVERLPELLDADPLPHPELWRGALEDLARGRAALAEARHDDVVHLDLAVWSAAGGLDPGRHALFGATERDRALVLGGAGAGTTCRLVLSTLSFFDLATRTTQPRPNLAALAARLNEAEGADPAAELAWRHQPQDSPSPELWFGRRVAGLYHEHAGAALAPSRLAPQIVRREVVDALRASWEFPD